ncbi:phosphate ABC transporter substrate-binding protein PstS [Salinibacterium sp. M195]|uniref:phosphate ABC transporter substrate-binding protein PstS n=1 Tax=Salinibacterium sp. M195 TaxID=2583374 RepID=UPI001C625AF3|nr:phosphate ABC transporter substrate-binding protein PstS [Salinibacterium sp. M195]QYH35495.1 phosphate ABC transporter substrate-binding protein PstS [Salinibacterium sp. M195]
MKFTRLGTVSIIAMTTALTLSGCVTAPVGDGTGLSGTIIGAGASSQQSAQESWVRGFQLANVRATVEYDPIGSGGGRDTFVGGGAVFAASDRAFTVDEIAESDFVSCVPGTGILEIPAYISPIAIIFSLEGIDSLNLDADTIAAIFMGEVNRWDDEAIVEQNPGVELPDQRITAVHRADDSGTTANFTSYLAEAAPGTWDLGDIEKWPIELGGEAAPQTSGVVDAVTNGTGTIGYADASRAGDLGTVAVKVGEEYVSYSPEAAAAIVDVSPFGEGRGATDFAVEIDRASTASGVYPVVLISYLIACNEYVSAEDVDVIRGYLDYVISPEGQQAAAAGAGSAPISATLFDKANAAVAAIK